MEPQIGKGWIFIIITSLILYSGYIVYETAGLPERVATHFNFSGTPDGWMTKSKNLTFFLIMGAGIAAFLVSIGTSIQHLPSKYLNVPDPHYWRSAEHYPRACLHIFKMLVILSVGLLIFLASIFHQVAQANEIHPPHLSNGTMGIYTTSFLVFLGGWSLLLFPFFLRKPQ